MTDDNLQLAPEEARIATILRSMTVADLEFESPPTSLWDDINAAAIAVFNQTKSQRSEDSNEHRADDEANQPSKGKISSTLNTPRQCNCIKQA